MNENFARQEICRVGKSLFDRGYVHSSAGNISIKLDDGFLITPTDAVLGFLEPESISKVDLSGSHISGEKPSKTLALHKSIYSTTAKYLPNTSCIIHTHSTYCVALTLKNDLENSDAELLKPITPYQVMKVGRVPVIPYKRPGDSQVLDLVGERIDQYLSQGIPIRAVMLSSLGPLVWHDSAAKTMATLEELEESAKLCFLLDQAGKTMLPSQIQELKEVFNSSW